MFYLIDWLSFSIEAKTKDLRSAGATLKAIHEELLKCLGEELLVVLGWNTAEYGKGRPPHPYSLRVKKTGFTVFVAPQHDRVLCELSGTTCRILDEHGLMLSILERTHQFMSRLDLAVDILTEVGPAAFVADGYNGRFTSAGSYNSPSGKTEYIGSKKSDRYARVYRYNKPHDREKFLRIEMVMKRKYAKLYAQRLIQDGLKSSIFYAGEEFGWQSVLWDVPNAQASEITVGRRTRSNDKTLRWLEEAVVPAFLRLVRSGGFDEWEDWLVANIVDKLRKVE